MNCTWSKRQTWARRRSSPIVLTAILTLSLVATEARAELFEFLSYSPPSGWKTQTDASGRLYQRTDAAGSGVILLFPSSAANGTPADAFAAEWREKVQPIVAAPAPSPQVQQAGEILVAIGITKATLNATEVAVTFVVLTGGGRQLSVLGLANGTEVLSQVAAFFGSLDVAPVASPSSPKTVAEIELIFDVPRGYVSRREADGVVLSPVTVDRKTPCTYGIKPARGSRGQFEADAQAAFAELFGGWEKQYDESRSHIRKGIASGGWPFYWYRAYLKRGITQLEYATGMVMVVPAGPGRVSIVYGTGEGAHCLAEDESFTLLFDSLRPLGWTSDGGEALRQQLVGSWIWSQVVGNANASLYEFDADGTYFWSADATISRIDINDSTAITQSAKPFHHGRYVLRGNELELRREGRKAERYRIRIVDHYDGVGWSRRLGLKALAEDVAAGSQQAVEYWRRNWQPKP